MAGTAKGSLHLVKPSSDDSRRKPSLRPQRPTVLIVDDEDAIRDFLRSALEAEGYGVLAAGDGEAALTLCERYQPNVILLDLMMPRLDGLGFLHRFRRRHGLNSASIYIMSAVRTAVEHAEAAGVSGAFLKPFDLEEVLDTIAADVGRIPAHERESEAGEASYRPA
ncbi:MAG: response regulator [Chloroflexota bacterium]